ncbi:MAG: lysylphosphatidylglycerol synthase transmembrane domain-containing protein [Bacteroidales bacterium]
MKKSQINLLIKIAGSLLILFVLFKFIKFDTDSFLKTLKEIQLPLFLASLSGVIIVLGIKSFRWHLILKRDGMKYSPGLSFGAYMASFTIGLITPGRIGEIARLYYLRQKNDIDFTAAFRTIVIDRIFDLGVLVLLGFAALLFYTFPGTLPAIGYIGVAVVLFFIALFAGTFIMKKIAASEKFEKNPVIQFIAGCLSASSDRYSIVLWLITLLAYLAFYGAISMIFLSLGIEMPIADIALILSVVGLATILPISFAGFGTREMSLVYLLSMYGISSETAISFSLLQFTAFFLWGGIIGLIFWLLMPISMDKIKEDSAALKGLFKKNKA